MDRSYIDMGVYTEKHNLRMYGSCKRAHVIHIPAEQYELGNRFQTGRCHVKTKSMKLKISTDDLIAHRRVVLRPLDMSPELIEESLITDSSSPQLVFDSVHFPEVMTRLQARPARYSMNSSQPESKATGDFYADNVKSNLYNIIEKAAEQLCGGIFKVRVERVPSLNYVMYNVDRKQKGMCKQCRTTHDCDNASCSLKRVDTAIAEIYKLSISCYRFRPTASMHKYKQVYTIIKIRGVWKIKN